jgi:hypothetical protein
MRKNGIRTGTAIIFVTSLLGITLISLQNEETEITLVTANIADNV